MAKARNGRESVPDGREGLEPLTINKKRIEEEQMHIRILHESDADAYRKL